MHFLKQKMGATNSTDEQFTTAQDVKSIVLRTPNFETKLVGPSRPPTEFKPTSPSNPFFLKYALTHSQDVKSLSANNPLYKTVI